MAASTSWDYFSDHYIDNDLYLKGDSEVSGGRKKEENWWLGLFF